MSLQEDRTVDATYSTFHIGPRPLADYNETFKLDLTIAGVDPVTVDTVGAKVLGLDPNTIRYLKWAEDRGIGIRNLNMIKVLGTPIEKAYVNKGITIEYFNRKNTRIKVLNYEACTGCFGRVSCTALQEGLRGKRYPNNDYIYIVLGPEATLEKVKKDTGGEATVILCGNCAAPTFYNQLNRENYIFGCPPPLYEIEKS